MEEQAILSEKNILKVSLTSELLLKARKKITIADHGKKRGFLWKCIVRFGIGMVKAMRPKNSAQLFSLFL